MSMWRFVHSPHSKWTSLCFGLPKTLGGRHWPGAILSVRTGRLSEHWLCPPVLMQHARSLYKVPGFNWVKVYSVADPLYATSHWLASEFPSVISSKYLRISEPPLSLGGSQNVISMSHQLSPKWPSCLCWTWREHRAAQQGCVLLADGTLGVCLPVTLLLQEFYFLSRTTPCIIILQVWRNLPLSVYCLILLGAKKVLLRDLE